MRKKTHEEFIQQMEVINPNIEILSRYEKDSIKVKARCKKCGYEWESTPSNLLQGKGCKKCHFKKLHDIKIKPHDTFVAEMKKSNPNIEILGKYTGRKNKIECACKIHNKTFYGAPGHLLDGKTGCPECIKMNNHLSGLKSNDEFKMQVKIKNPQIHVIGMYNGAKAPIEVQCKKCGHIWSPIASSILSGFGCPKCNTSKGENLIEYYLNKNGISFEHQKKFDDLRGKRNMPLSYDFYVPDYNLLIEFQGRFHDGTALFVDADKYYPMQQERDKKKKKYAEDNGYNFLEIWYYEIKHVEEILLNKINDIKDRVTTTPA